MFGQEAWMFPRLPPIVILLENHPEAARIFDASQGSADDAGQEGPLGGDDAGLRQKDRRFGVVFKQNDYSFHFIIRSNVGLFLCR